MVSQSGQDVDKPGLGAEKTGLLGTKANAQKARAENPIPLFLKKSIFN